MIAEVTIVDRHPASPRGAFLSCPGVSHRPRRHGAGATLASRGILEC